MRILGCLAAVLALGCTFVSGASVRGVGLIKLAYERQEFMFGDRVGCMGCQFVWDSVRKHLHSRYPGLAKQLIGGAYLREAETLVGAMGDESAMSMIRSFAPAATVGVRTFSSPNEAAQAATDGEPLDDAPDSADVGGGLMDVAMGVVEHAVEHDRQGVIQRAAKSLELIYEDVCTRAPEIFSDSCDIMYQEIDTYVALFPLLAEKCSYKMCKYKGMCGDSANAAGAEGSKGAMFDQGDDLAYPRDVCD